MLALFRGSSVLMSRMRRASQTIVTTLTRNTTVIAVVTAIKQSVEEATINKVSISCTSKVSRSASYHERKIFEGQSFKLFQISFSILSINHFNFA